MPNKDTDILIAGGGFAGLALALGVSKCLGGDVSTTVVAPTFPKPSESHDRRASALSASSRRILEALDIWPEIEPVTQPVSSIEITDSGSSDINHPTLLRYETRLASGEPSMYITENHALLTALHRAATKAKSTSLIAGASVTALTTTLDTASVTLSTGKKISTRLAIAADGRRSTIRDAAGISIIGWPYDQRAILATVNVTSSHNGRAFQHFLPSGPFAMLPMTGNRFCITWSEETIEASRKLALSEPALMSEIARHFGSEFGSITLTSSPQSYPLEMHIARTFIAQRTALIGDAARGVHPIAGQGLNLGLRDVAALVEVIADAARLGLDIGDGNILERYQRWRRFDSVTATAAFDALNRTFSRTSTFERTIRSAGLNAVNRAQFLKSMLVDEASGLTGEHPRMLEGQLP